MGFEEIYPKPYLLFEDEALRKDMGQRCHAIALKEYRLELPEQRYLELYSQVPAKARHASPSSATFLVK